MLRRTRPARYPGCPVTIEAARAKRVPLRPTSWGLVDFVIAVVGIVLLSAVSALLVSGFGLVDTGTGLVFLMAIPWFAMAGWPVLVTATHGNGAILDLGIRFARRDFAIGLITGAVALGLGLLAAAVTQLIVGDFSSAAGDAAVQAAGDSTLWESILIGLLVAIGAPFAEEILFRGLLWAGLRRRGWGALSTGITTTLIFALFHFEVTRLGVLLVVGATLAVARQRSGSLGASITAHAVNNLPGALAIALL